MKKKCIICGTKIAGRHDYCRKCFDSKIHELQMEYGEQEGPTTGHAKDDGEALASGPVAENTHH